MNRIGLSEGQVMLQACLRALPPPDLTETPIIDRPKDPYLVLLFGVNYDTSLIYVNISPRALALQILTSKAADDEENNEFFTLEHLEDSKDPRLSRRVLPVSWDVFLGLKKRLGVTRYNGPLEFVWNGIYDHRDPDIKEMDEEGLKSAGEFEEAREITQLDSSSRKQLKAKEDSRLKARRSNKQLPAPAAAARDSSDNVYTSRDARPYIDEDQDYNANYDDGSSSDSADELNPFEDPLRGSRWNYSVHSRLKSRPVRGPVPIPYGVHNPTPRVEESFPSHFQKLVDRLTSEISSILSKINWSVDNPLKFTDRKTAGSWNVAIHDFHAERLRIWRKRTKPKVFTSRPVPITLNFRPTFDLYDPRLWVLEDDAPEPGDDPFEFAQLGQNSLQYMLDVVRIQWDAFDPIDVYYIPDPIFANSENTDSPEDSTGPLELRLKEPMKHTFGYLGPPRKAILELGLRLFTEDLKIETLESDFCELAKFAIFKYISSKPCDDMQMRQSLLVLWELTKIITLITGEQPGRKDEKCTC
ncbi:hypothetical protein TWF718_009326 [Orbilia javanica]|uniref:Uncharacterized protein n=1 Tax=Orbilia javanica TaxID=47235 RepID=A0AAN8RCI3_9PEZI